MSDVQSTTKRGGKRPNSGPKPKHTEDKLEQGAAYLYPRTWRLLEAQAKLEGVPAATLLRCIVERTVTPARASDYVEGGGGILGNTGSGD